MIARPMCLWSTAKHEKGLAFLFFLDIVMRFHLRSIMLLCML